MCKDLPAVSIAPNISHYRQSNTTFEPLISKMYLYKPGKATVKSSLWAVKVINLSKVTYVRIGDGADG